MMIDLTRGIPLRPWNQQYSEEYNREVSRTDNELVVERCDNYFTPYFQRYRKATFLGLIVYWELVTRGDEVYDEHY